MIFLVTDPLSAFLPSVVMDFIVPGLVGGAVFTYLFIKIAMSKGWI